MKKKVKLMTDDQTIEFAINYADENCRSIVESACVRQVRPRSKALYQFNANNPDQIMLKDVESALLYLRSRGTMLPFKMSEKDGWVWFDEVK